MNKIELRAFAHLQKLFHERGWDIPMMIDIPAHGTTGFELAQQLDVPPEKIEAVFINGVVYGLAHKIKPGDRVALVPFGTPSIYRVHFGFYNKNNR